MLLPRVAPRQAGHTAGERHRARGLVWLHGMRLRPGFLRHFLSSYTLNRVILKSGSYKKKTHHHIFRVSNERQEQHIMPTTRKYSILVSCATESVDAFSQNPCIIPHTKRTECLGKTLLFYLHFLNPAVTTKVTHFLVASF